MASTNPDHRQPLPAERAHRAGHPDGVIAGLADRQHGVVSRAQLTAAGVTRAMVESRVRSGHLVRLHRGVYAVGHRRLRPAGTALAALLAAGPGAVLSHRDAAGLHGLRPANHRETDVTVDGRRRPVPGVRVHRALLVPDEVSAIDGLPVTTVERTLVDLAYVVPRDHLAKAVHEADRRRQLDVPTIERIAARVRTRRGHGHAALAATLAELRRTGTQPTRSALERRFLALVDRAGLPRPAMNAIVLGREVDAWWADGRVAVEADGWRDHGTRRAFQRDREKGNWLALHGIVVLRFTHRDVVHAPEDVVAQLRRALAC